MKAAVLRGPREVRIEAVSDPDLVPGHVIVNVKACGICGSDLDGFKGLIPHRRPLGIIMGHEAAGVVVAVGDGVANVDVGARVAIDPQISCGQCPRCEIGETHICDSVQGLGSALRGFRNGANADLVSVPASNVSQLPDGMSFAEGAMAEPLGNAIHLVSRAGVRPGHSVGVFGAGTQGLLAIQTAIAQGATNVYAVDLSGYKLDVAKRLGAKEIIQPPLGDPVKTLLELTDGEGVDVAIECVGIEATYRQALLSLRKRGSLACLGNLDEEIRLPLHPLIYRELTILGSTGFSWSNDPALEMIATRQVDVGAIISHRFRLDSAQTAYERAVEPESLKVMIVADET